MFKENYIINGKIICETGLHIGGSNDNIDIGGSDNVIIRDVVSDLPFIPGSSLKGKLRSLYELNDKKSSESVLENKGGPAVDEECNAAKIFGISADTANKLKFPTRLIVRDSFPSEESIELWKNHDDIVRGTELKYENNINRLNAKATPRNIERVPKGSSFDFEMVFSVYDGDDNNLIGVFEAMRLLEDNYLGSSGTRGSGKIKFSNITLVKRDKDYYRYDEDEKSIVENVELSEVISKVNNKDF